MLYNGIIGSVILISVNNVVLKVSLNGSVVLADLGLSIGAQNLINDLGEMGIRFIFDSFKNLFDIFVWLFKTHSMRKLKVQP